MKNIGVLTNIRSPYKTLQLNEFSKIKDTNIKVYYTEINNKKIKWEEHKSKINEIALNEYKIFGILNIKLNKGLVKLVRDNDIILLFGYSQISFIIVSIICRIYNKPYILFFDGISKFKINDKESILKSKIKKMVIKSSDYIMANGSISKKYLINKMNYPENRIYNQFLSVDNKTINKLYRDRTKYRKIYREKYNIDFSKKVIIYSGRLIRIKNVSRVIESISEMENKKDILFFVAGGGELQKEIKNLSERLDVNIIITGFINNQEELFKHYFMADLLVLPSIDEPWGLVVNEAMACGLPVLVSEIAGCCEDLINNGYNGYLINPYDKMDIKDKLEKMLYLCDLNIMGNRSKKMILDWNYENSRVNLEKIIAEMRGYYDI